MRRFEKQQLVIRAAHSFLKYEQAAFDSPGINAVQLLAVKWGRESVFQEGRIRLGYGDVDRDEVKLSKLIPANGLFFDPHFTSALERAGVPVGLATVFDCTDHSQGILVTGYIQPELLDFFGIRLVTDGSLEMGYVVEAGKPLLAPFLGKSARHEVMLEILRQTDYTQSSKIHPSPEERGRLKSVSNPEFALRGRMS